MYKWFVSAAVLLLTGCTGSGYNKGPAPGPLQLRSIRDRIIKDIEPLLTSPWPEVRALAVQALGNAAEVPVGVCSERALTDSDAEVRVRAVRVLGMSTAKQARLVLERIFQSSVPARVRYAALEALGDTVASSPATLAAVQYDAFGNAPEAAQAALEYLCRHPELSLALDWETFEKGPCAVRLLAAVALLNLGDTAGFSALRDAVNSEAVAERRTLAWALAFLKRSSRWAEQAFKVLLGDSNMDVRLTAAATTGALGLDGLAGILGNTLAASRTELEAAAYADALARIGSSGAAEQLAAIAVQGNAIVCLALARATERKDGAVYRNAVGKRLAGFQRLYRGSPDATVRAALARLLIACGALSELPELEKAALHGTEPAARAAALEGLAEHGDRHTLDRLADFLSRRQNLPGKPAARERLLAAEAALRIAQRLLSPGFGSVRYSRPVTSGQ